jgi:hypothetical protein
MARITYVKKAQQRFVTVPVKDEDGNTKKVPVIGRSGQQKVTKKGVPVFRKVTVEDRTKPLPLERCGACGKAIEIGTPYKWVKPKSGPYGGTKRSRHASCPSWKPSELTSSTALSSVYAAQENASEQLGKLSPEDTADDIRQIVQDAAEGVREGAEAWRESASNIEDGFGHSTYQSDELNEKADTLESAADDLENWDEIEDFDEDEVRAEVEDDVKGEVLDEILSELQPEESVDLDGARELEDWDEEEYERRLEAAIEEALTEKRTEWFDEAINAAESAIDNIEIP